MNTTLTGDHYACSVHSDCHTHYGILSHCSPETSLCVASKSLFQPFMWQEIVLPLYSLAAQSIASSTGVGGGILLTIVYNLAGVQSATSSALSTSCIFGAACANYLILSLRKHPTRKRPLIHYDIAILVEPIVLVGVTIGVFLNVMLPSWCTLLIAFVVLLYLDIKAWKKAVQMFIKDIKKKLAKRRESVSIDDDASADSPLSEDGDKAVTAKQPTETSPRGKTAWVDEETEMEDVSTPVAAEGDSSSPRNNEEKVSSTDLSSEEEPSPVATKSTPQSEAGSEPEIETAEKNTSETDAEASDKVNQESIEIAWKSDIKSPSKSNLIASDDVEKKLAAIEAGADIEDPNRPLTEDELAKLKRLTSMESCQIPIFKLALLMIAWLITFASSLLRGSQSSDSIIGVETCSPVFWVITAAILPPLLFLSCSYAIILRSFHSFKKKWRYDFAEGDVQWNTCRTFFVPILFLSAGLVASLLGLGGGAISVGIFLDKLNLPPEVAVATSSFLILFTSSSSSAQYMVFGILPWDYALLFAGFGFIGAFIGTLGMGMLIKKTGMRSLVILLLASLLFFGILVSTVNGIIKIVTKARNGEDVWGFKKFC